ncbi:MAG: agmatinase, partial [Nitrososphaerales archaeon]
VEVLGVPFDSTSTYRAGSRFGPNAIREAFLNIEMYSNRLDVDLEELSVKDLGNLSQTGDAKQMSEAVERVVSEMLSEDQAPAVLGGEHTLSYATFRAAPKDTALIVFDAHGDIRDEFADRKFSHTTWLRRFIEERGAGDVIHIGLRAATREEIDYLNRVEMVTISAQTILTNERSEKILADLLRDFSQVYVSVDMDVLDPAYAPGVGNPEAAGISTAQLLEFLYTLNGKKVLGFDIVEVCPPYDTGASAVAAAKVMLELTSLVHLGEK